MKQITVNRYTAINVTIPDEVESNREAIEAYLEEHPELFESISDKDYTNEADMETLEDSSVPEGTCCPSCGSKDHSGDINKDWECYNCGAHVTLDKDGNIYLVE